MQDVPRPDKFVKFPPADRWSRHNARVVATGPDPAPVVASLRSLRRSALFAVALFALGIGLIALRSGGVTTGDVDRRVTYAALALAGISILTRRSPGAAGNPRVFVATQVASVLAAVGLGLLGAVIALRAGPWQVGLIYNLAALLLLFRPPASFALAPPRR